MQRRHLFIQGGARGLGLALVERLLEDDERNCVIASTRTPERAEALHSLREHYGKARLHIIGLDITDADSLLAAREAIDAITDRLELMLSCAGLLHDDQGLWPEKRFADIEPDNLARAFAVNASGPLLMIKHFHDLLTHGDRAVIASLSARVGSITDNRHGGWYAYRASKAAQNQITRTAAIELARHSRQLICVGLHPGTVDTGLSQPFQRNVPARQLQTPATAAAHLLEVIAGLEPEQSGQVFDWAGEAIPP